LPLINPVQALPYALSVGPNPPASPVIGDRWIRANSGSNLSLDSWDWIWDGQHWASPLQAVTASVWNQGGNIFFGILGASPYQIKNKRLMATLFIAQSSAGSNAGTLSALMWNGAISQWAPYGELWIVDNVVSTYRPWTNTQPFIIPLNSHGSNFLALNLWGGAIPGTFYGFMGFEYVFIWPGS
jgi:hypothetical protein